MKHEAIYKLYTNVIRVNDNEDGSVTAYDVNEQIVAIDMSAVETKATELQAEENAKVQAKIDLKASAKAKLIAGEALTEDEANTIVI
jgi:hypothetical protein|tara:strand:+ start:437 stop:697 length:261 start_codon:yes stop_codon:yes gene_type:complete